MIIWSFINCPTVICSPTVCYFSLEKPLVKPTTPESSFCYICLEIYFFLAFIFRSIKPKNTKIPCCNLFVPWSIYPIYKFTARPLPILRHRTPKGVDNPFTTSSCEVLFVCRGCLRCVAWFSYWFDNLGLITKGNTHHRCTASSLRIWGNTDVVLADIKNRGRLWESVVNAEEYL